VEADAVKMQHCPAYEAIDNCKVKVQPRGTIKDVAVTDTSQADNNPVPMYLTVY